MWYTGTISQAIAYAKMKHYIFMVYAHSSNEASKEMEKTWEEEEVQMLCKEHFVPIRFDISSKEGRQFNQIYPVLHTPSTYFIGQNGMPIEALAGNIRPNKFLIRAGEAIQIHQQHIASIEAAGGSLNQPANLNQAKYEEPPASPTIRNKPVSHPEQPHGGQIDRERKAAENQNRTDREGRRVGEEAANVASVGSIGAVATVDHANEICRLQFRFPDGSSTSREFHPHEILEDVVAFVGQHVGSDFGPFTLATLHPRRQLNEDHYLETLESLNLVPTGVLMVLPGSSDDYEQSNWQDDLKDFFWWLLTPIIVLFHLLMNLIANKKSKQPRRTIPAANNAIPISNTSGNVRHRGNPANTQQLGHRNNQGNLNANIHQQ